MNHLTIEEVAEVTKLTVPSIRTYQYRGTFPPPDCWDGNRALWRGVTVAIFMQNRRKRGRPPGKKTS